MYSSAFTSISEQTSGCCAQRENSSRALDNLAEGLSRTSWRPSAARLRLTSARGARATMKTSQTFLAQEAGPRVSLGFTSSDCTRARATSSAAWSGSGAATWVSPVSVSTTGQVTTAGFSSRRKYLIFQANDIPRGLNPIVSFPGKYWPQDASTGDVSRRPIICDILEVV